MDRAFSERVCACGLCAKAQERRDEQRRPPAGHARCRELAHAEHLGCSGCGALRSELQQLSCAVAADGRQPREETHASSWRRAAIEEQPHEELTSTPLATHPSASDEQTHAAGSLPPSGSRPCGAVSSPPVSSRSCNGSIGLGGGSVGASRRTSPNRTRRCRSRWKQVVVDGGSGGLSANPSNLTRQ